MAKMTKPGGLRSVLMNAISGIAGLPAFAIRIGTFVVAGFDHFRELIGETATALMHSGIGEAEARAGCGISGSRNLLDQF